MFETILSFVNPTPKSSSQGNGAKSVSGNGDKDLKSGIKKSVVTQAANG